MRHEPSMPVAFPSPFKEEVSSFRLKDYEKLIQQKYTDGLDKNNKRFSPSEKDLRREPERSEKKYQDDYRNPRQSFPKDRFEPEYRQRNPTVNERDRDRSRRSNSDRSRSNNKDLDDSYAPGKHLWSLS